MKTTLLIVDDEPDIREYLKNRLEKSGFCVITASNGKECIDNACQNRPDLIILDIVMPLMDGYEVVKQLKTNPSTSTIPIIMHSVRRETDSIFKSMDLGSIDYVIKPAAFEDLLHVINRYIEA